MYCLCVNMYCTTVQTKAPVILWPFETAISCNAFRKFSSHQSVSNTKTIRLTLHKELVAVCSQNLRKSVYTLQVEYVIFNALKPELNPICYLLALLGAYHFLHVSRIRVKLLTFRLLMSYIYGAPILDVSRSHTTTQHSR